MTSITVILSRRAVPCSESWPTRGSSVAREGLPISFSQLGNPDAFQCTPHPDEPNVTSSDYPFAKTTLVPSCILSTKVSHLFAPTVPTPSRLPHTSFLIALHIATIDLFCSNASVRMIPPYQLILQHFYPTFTSAVLYCLSLDLYSAGIKILQFIPLLLISISYCTLSPDLLMEVGS